MFLNYTVFYDIWSLKVSKTTEMYLLTGSPNAPQPPISASPPTLGTIAVTTDYVNGCLKICTNRTNKFF